MVIGLRFSFSVLIAACVCFGSSDRARAESAVVLPHAGDSRLEAARTASHRVVVDTLREQSFTVRTLTTKPARNTSEVQNSCTQIICAPAMLVATATDLAVGIAVWDGEDGPQVNITLIDALGRKYPGYALVVGQDATDAARAAFLEARSLQLLGPGPWIHVRGVPAGAEVIIDAKPVGVLPYRGAISPGDHDLEVRASGYNAKQLPIVVSLEPTTTALVELELVRAAAGAATPAPETAPLANDYVNEDPAREPTDKASPWNFVLGGILAAGGLALATIEPAQTLAKDGDCANDACSERYAAGGETFAKIGVGALLAAAGVTLMIWQPLRVDAEISDEHALLRARLIL
jgi:hypothetical protein